MTPSDNPESQVFVIVDGKAVPFDVTPMPDVDDNPQESPDSLVLADLNERIDRAEEELLSIPSHSSAEKWRLNGKIEGLRLVKDWLRSYE